MSAENQLTEQEQPRRPGRPKKAEVMATERRRRKTGAATHKLKIPDHVIEKHPDMEFRWGKDDEGRMQQLTQNDDWDKVPGVTPIHAGVGAGGKAIKHHLLMKPKAFMAADRAEKMARLDEMEKHQLRHPDAKQAKETGAEMYSVPGNKL